MKIAQQEAHLIQVMGTENTIVDAARVSFAKRAKDYTNEQNLKLINYLARHNHWTPFSHCIATFQLKAPIFVARQLMRHTVGLTVNETSRRYVDEEPEFFFPKHWRGKPVNAKQGSSNTFVDEMGVSHQQRILWSEDICNVCLNWYNNNITNGMAPEQARMILPQNMMTEWWWTGSLAAWSRVFKLRLDPHTQQETREVVQMMHDQLLPSFPNALKALMEA